MSPSLFLTYLLALRCAALEEHPSAKGDLRPDHSDVHNGGLSAVQVDPSGSALKYMRKEEGSPDPLHNEALDVVKTEHVAAVKHSQNTSQNKSVESKDADPSNPWAPFKIQAVTLNKCLAYQSTGNYTLTLTACSDSDPNQVFMVRNKVASTPGVTLIYLPGAQTFCLGLDGDVNVTQFTSVKTSWAHVDYSPKVQFHECCNPDSQAQTWRYDSTTKSITLYDVPDKTYCLYYDTVRCKPSTQPCLQTCDSTDTTDSTHNFQLLPYTGVASTAYTVCCEHGQTC